MPADAFSPTDVLIDQLFPLVVPAKLFQGGAPVFQHALAETGLVLAWAVRSAPSSFMYLTHDKADVLEAASPGWQARGMRNMVKDQPVTTHEKTTARGALFWCGMMHPDAFGSSRVLLAPAWNRLFPGGYWLAMPDRSCGLVFSKAASPDEQDEMRSMVATMHAKATTPLSDDLFEAQDLALPESWYP